jgi:DNA-binding winged helix-turn-helix (wHTH) protein
VEFDGRLNTALMKLRAPLNDKSENPIFLETVPRRGYRFIAPIEVALASYEMWPELRVRAVRQLTHTGQVDPWGKVTDGTRIYPLCAT